MSASYLREKLADAAQVQKVTGTCPGVAIHIPWDREDDWRAVAFFASPTRSVKSTGNILNVDGGVAAAYPR